MSLHCHNCGFVADTPHRFCSNCGVELRTSNQCRFCATELEADDRFCFNCGNQRGQQHPQVPNSGHHSIGDIPKTTSIAVAAAGLTDRSNELRSRQKLDQPPQPPSLRPPSSAQPSVSITRRARNWVSSTSTRVFDDDYEARENRLWSKMTQFGGEFVANARFHTSLWRFDEFEGVSDRTRITIEVVTVAVLTLIALYLRINDLENVPLGFELNESGLSIDALRVLNGEWIGAWSPVHGGQPAGFSYWTAFLFKIGEPNVFWARLASVLPGVALIPVAYILLRSLFPFRLAVVSVALLTFSVWFVIASRMGVQMMFAVFMGFSSMLAALETCRTRRVWVGVAGGLLLGLSIYSFKAFLPYFAGIWGIVALLFLVSSHHRNTATVWFLLLSIIVAYPVLNILVFSGFIQAELAKEYYGDLNLWDFSRYPSRLLELLLLVNTPISSGTWDGTSGSPLLHTLIIRVFFWLGLMTIVINVNQRPYQVFLIGWFIAASAALLVEGAESRRYLFGVFFVLTTVAIGINVIARFFIQDASKLSQMRFPAMLNSRKFGVAFGAAIIAAFCSHAFITDRDAFHEWSVGPVRWYFEAGMFDALKLVDDAEEDYRVALFNPRSRIDDERIRFLYPDLKLVEGAAEHGGEGVIRADFVDGNTAFLLFGDYMEMIDDLETLFPGQIRVDRNSREIGADNDQILYIAYLVHDPRGPKS